MIDHTGIIVSDFERSRTFYTAALDTIGYKLLLEFPSSVTGSTNVAGFGVPPKADFWISQGTPNSPRVHVAFRVSTRALVDAFHRAALATGGTDHGAPGLRPHYHSNYYGAFVLDPDGHNIEPLCHEPE
jgi:catechol 2,3-dioxygenase-like lactoylglutathione lyase family enzyme